MKRIAVILFLVFAYSAGKTQNRYADSIKSVLAITKNPVERFDLLNKIEEARFVCWRIEPNATATELNHICIIPLHP